MVEEGKKDVTTATERTAPLPTDKLVLINSETQEVMSIPLGNVTGGEKVAPADFDDFFGL